jgi:Ca-activated chloride channel family protein
MSLLVPAALAVLGLAVPLVVLYMLRSRRERVVVPSLMLWEGTGQAVSSAVPWQRLRLTALLLLQLVALALFAFALARPFLVQETLLGPHTVLVLDTSGSMAMAGRLDLARQRALELVREASEANLISIVEAGPTPRVLVSFSRDPGALTAVVEDLEPTGGKENLAEGLRLARGLATPDHPTSILILSDGGPPGPAPVEEPVVGARHLLYRSSDENLAITAFTTEATAQGSARAFLEVSNFGGRQHRLEVEVSVNGLPAGQVELEVGPGGRARRTVPMQAGPGDVVSARLVANQDALPLDDQASLLLGGGPERTVAVLGEGSVFLEGLLQAAPGFGPAAGTPPDLLIIDRGHAGSLDRPAWLIRPEVPPPGVEVVGLVRNAVVTYQRPGEPLLEGIDLSDLAVAEAQVVEAHNWLPLVRAGDAPLLLLGEVDGHRAVYATFDLTHSNLPVQVAFPVLGARLLEWLAGGQVQAGITAPAGVPIALAPPPGSTSEVAKPDGEVVALPPGAVLYTDTGAPGVYRVSYRAEDGSAEEGPTAVRQFAAQESAGGFRELQTSPPDLGARSRGELIREQAPWLVGLLLVIGLVEWWVGHGRPWPRRQLPRPSLSERAGVGGGRA